MILNNTQDVFKKLDVLKGYIAELGSLAIAFSGGVDSTFLAAAAAEVLKDRLLAITVVSSSFPERERSEAEEFCKSRGIKQIFLEFDELAVEGFKENPPDRCYICKKELFIRIKEKAAEYGIKHIAEGSNTDDNGDYRPGMRAIDELGIKSPLRYAGLSKADIRTLSKEMELPTWNKPSAACLSSRFAYGEEITREKLKMVEKAEMLLTELGFNQVRCRMHGTLARIEVAESEIERMMKPEIRGRIYREFKEIGFSYVTLDIAGYRMGSMNEVL